MAPPDATSMTASNEPVPDFRLHFESKGGTALADGLYEWTTVLNMQGGGRPRAAMLLNHHNGDLIGKPVGQFSDAIPMAQARQVARAFDQIMAKELPSPKGGDVRANMMKLEYHVGERKFAVDFNAMNRDYLAAILPVITKLHAIMTALLAKPEAALVVAVERIPDTGAAVKFQLKLTNVGTRELMIGDPRVAGKNPQLPRALVNVAPVPVKTPGVMEIPPRWQPVAIEAAPAGTIDSGLTIKAGDSILVPAKPWMPPKPGEYVVQGVWQDGAGAAKADPTKLQPAIPKEMGAEGKLLMLRGAGFSKYLKIAIAPRAG